MKYPFADPATQFQDLIKPLSELAHSEDPFDCGFANRLPNGKAYDFDKIKERVCTYRTNNLSSADAFLIGQKDSNPWYYFIEFKNQKADNIESNQETKPNKLRQKAFDSLSVLSMTFGRAVPMEDLQKHSSFIVVYAQQDYSIRFTQTLANQPLWHLDKLLNNGFYADIQTIHDGEFAKMILPYMK